MARRVSGPMASRRRPLMFKPFKKMFGPFSGFFLKFFSFFFNRVVVLVGYLHSDYSSKINITLNNNIVLLYKSPWLKQQQNPKGRKEQETEQD